MVDRSGQPFGPYRLVRFITGGGLGDVYEAPHPQQGHVTLKLLKRQLDEQGLHDFIHDVRAVLLRHSHIKRGGGLWGGGPDPFSCHALFCRWFSACPLSTRHPATSDHSRRVGPTER
jgi:hypothetical protein